MSFSPVYQRFVSKDESYEDFGVYMQPLTIQSNHKLSNEEVNKVVRIYARYLDASDDYVRADGRFCKEFNVTPALATDEQKMSSTYQALVLRSKERTESFNNIQALKNRGIYIRT